MAERKPNAHLPPPHPEWTAFASRHPNHRSLADEAIYSLEVKVIDSICAEIPGFFSPQDEEFERDLVNTAGLGFFHQRPMSVSLGGEHPGAQPTMSVCASFN